MSQIQLHIHDELGGAPLLVEIEEIATIEELLKKAYPDVHADFYLVFEASEDGLNPSHRLGDLGIRHGHALHRRHKVHLVVNGKRKLYLRKTINFDEVVTLAYGTPNYDSSVYTVTYYRGPERNPKGSLSKGETVIVKDGMVFDVIRTDKS